MAFEPKLTMLEGPGPMDQIGKGPPTEPAPPFASLDGLLDYHTTMLRGYWLDEEREPDDQYAPMIVCVCGNGDVVPIVASGAFGNEGDKDSFAKFMRERMKEWGVVRYVFMSEAWVARMNDQSDVTLMPSERPDREEVMILVAADQEQAKSRTLIMQRDWSTGLVTDLISDPIAEGADLGGRFATLLKEEPRRGMRPLPDEDFEMFRGALSMNDAKPDRFDDYEGDKEKCAAIWESIETSQKLAATEGPLQRFGQERLYVAVSQAQAMIRKWVEGWAKRDGPDSVHARTLGEANKKRDQRKARRH